MAFEPQMGNPRQRVMRTIQKVRRGQIGLGPVQREPRTTLPPAPAGQMHPQMPTMPMRPQRKPRGRPMPMPPPRFPGGRPY